MKLLNKILGIGYSILFVSVVVACTSQQIAQVEAYSQSVSNTCAIATDLINSPLGSIIGAAPAVSSAVNLIKAACTTQQAINALVQSPTSVAWLNTLIVTVKSKGTIIPPAPVELSIPDGTSSQ